MATATGAYATAAALKTLIGITDSSDDTLIGLICDRVNQYIESQTKQVIAPITSDTYLYDGNGLSNLWLPMPASGAAAKSIGGIRAITLLEFASETGGTFETIASTDYFLRDQHGMTGPYRWLRMSDLPAGDYSTFPEGIANIRITCAIVLLHRIEHIVVQLFERQDAGCLSEAKHLLHAAAAARVEATL